MSYKFFQNKSCEFFPCHGGQASTINCLFCFCPLYPSDDCGGSFTFTDRGIKDCSNCCVPHTEGGYDIIISKLRRMYNGTKTNRT